MRMWHAIASSHPPPSAKPLTAAMTGLGQVSILRNTSCPARARALASTGVWPDSSEMSAPATNARPAPVSITPAIASSTRISSIACPSSSIVASFKALSLSGRLTVRVATRSATSSVRNLKGIEMCLWVNLPASVERRRPLKSTQKVRSWATG